MRLIALLCLFALAPLFPGFAIADQSPVQPIADVPFVDVLQTLYAKYRGRVRVLPQSKSLLVTILEPNTAIKATGLSADGNWWRVVSPEGTIGYMWKEDAADQPIFTVVSFNAITVELKTDATLLDRPHGAVIANGFATVDAAAISLDGDWLRVFMPSGGVAFVETRMVNEGSRGAVTSLRTSGPTFKIEGD